MVSGKLRNLVFFVLLLGLVSVASAATITWTDGDPADHLWSSDDNWDPNKPTSADEVRITGDTVCVVDAAMVAPDGAEANTLNSGYEAGGPCILNVDGGELTSAGTHYIGYFADSDGYVNVSNGGSLTSAEFAVGRRADADGTLTINDGTVSSTGEIKVGYYGNGTLNLDGGTLDVGTTLHIARYEDSSGTMNIDGGDLTATAIVVGYSADGEIIMDSGTVTTPSTIIGRSLPSSSSITINNGTYNNTGELMVGYYSAGTLNVTGGYLISDGILSLARYTDSGTGIGGTGTMSVTGDGTVTVNNDIYVGRSGNVGTLTVSGTGTVTTTPAPGIGHLRIGYAASTNGSSVSVENGGTLDIGGDIRIGQNAGDYELTISGGDVDTNVLMIGTDCNSVGVVNISSGDLDASSGIGLGYYGAASGTLNVTGGSVTSGDLLYVGKSADATGVINVTNGSVTSGGYFQIGYYGVGTMTMNTGAVVASNSRMYVGDYGTGTLNVTSGSLTTTADLRVGNYDGGTGTMSVTGGSINSGVFHVGYGGNGTMTMTNATMTTSETNLGYNASGTGLMTINSGGTFSSTGEIKVGGNFGGTGTLDVDGGSLTSGGILSLARSGTATGTMNVTAGSATVSTDIYVGRYGGVGTLNVSGTGTVTTIAGSGTGHLRIGYADTTDGSSVSVATGGTLSIGNNIRIGENAGLYKLNITGGDVDSAWLMIGTAGSSVGEVNISSGSMDASEAIALGYGGTSAGTLNVTGGDVATPGNLTIGNSVTAGSCYVNLDGGTIAASNLVIGTMGLLDIEAGILTLAGDDRTVVENYVTAGLITGYGDSRNVIVYYDGSDTIVMADADLINRAWDPSPYDGEIIQGFDVNDVILTWSPGDSAAKHRIYFGETFDEVNNATTSTPGIYKGEQNLGDEDFDPGTLELGKDYYWRIDEVNGGDEWKGTVWMFTVEAYALVDDFESYADTAALQAVWGSNGDLEVDSGDGGYSAQSMAINYDNTSSPYYTEVVRDYGSDQDWSIADLKSLVIYFKGADGNAPDKLYVKLDDGTNNKAVYYDDPDAIAECWWQVWNIELAEFDASGVDLSKVRKITVGVGQNPPAAGGGSGTVYVDNIRLYPSACSATADLTDFSMIANSWLTTNASVSLDDDDDVDLDDLALFCSNYWLQPRSCAATGTIYATPQHMTLEKGQTGTTTLTWDTSGCQLAQVYCSINGGPESLVSTSPAENSLVVGDISYPNSYVFKLYQDTVHKTLLAWTSVTSHLSSDAQYGFSYWPQEYDSRCLNYDNWPTQRPIVEKDLDQMSSMSAGVVRLMIWPGGHWSMWTGFQDVYYEQTENIVDFLSLLAARDMQAFLVFANNYLDCGDGTPGHSWWMSAYGDTPEGFAQFLGDSKAWINGFVNAIENSGYKTTVFAYDIGAEYNRELKYVDWYIRYLLDESAIPLGKRHVSVLRIDGDTDLTDLAYQLTLSPPNGVARRLDFVDFRIYPDNYYLSMPVEEARDTCQDVFPHSTIFMGEHGYPAANSSEELTQQAEILDIAQQVIAMADPVPYYVHWQLWDRHVGGGYGWGYEPNSPKDVLGGMSELLDLAYNGDMEITSGGKPDGWTGDGSVPVSFVYGSGYADAATNEYYGSLTANSATGSAWISSQEISVDGGKSLYVNAYIRSNMENIKITVDQYDAGMTLITTSTGPAFTPTVWSMDSYLNRAGTWRPLLDSNTRKIIVNIVGDCQSNPAYLDVDAVSVWER